MNIKRKQKIFLPNVILLITGLIVITFSVIGILLLSFEKTQAPTVLNSQSNEFYVIGKDPTAIQKEKFTELTKQLNEKEVNYVTVSDLVAQSFVIDFFNWSNKDAAYDVGGLQYMFDPSTFNKVAHFDYYQKVDVFKEAYGSANLPTVKSVVSKTDSADDYEIEGQMYKAYSSTVKWDYAAANGIDISKFVSECELLMINVDGKIVIVEVSMMDNQSVNNGAKQYE